MNTNRKCLFVRDIQSSDPLLSECLCKLIKSLLKLCLSTCIVVCSNVHVIYCLQMGQRDDVIKQLRADLSEAQSQQRAVHDDVSADASIAPSLSQ